MTDDLKKPDAKVYGTYATAREAREVAERLPRPALVMSVKRMLLTGDPLAPRTVNPWAVLVG